MKLHAVICLFELSFAYLATAGILSAFNEQLRLALYYPTKPSYEGFGRLGHWRCGDWRSRYRIINCDDPFHPVVDYPPDFDHSQDGWGYSRLRIHGIAVYGYPALYKESDT